MMTPRKGWHTLRRLAALFILLDGLGAALMGHALLDWEARLGPRWYERTVLRFFYQWPEPLLRGKGLVQIMAGLLLLR